MMPSRGYLLCCIERTGSNLVARALSGTDLAGRPLEYFNPVEQDKAWMRDILGDSNLADGLPKILSAGTTPNGVFGAKLHWNHLRHLGMSISGHWNEEQRIAPFQALRLKLPELLPLEASLEILRSAKLRPQDSPYALLRTWMPDLRVVWLRRRNMVARAISHFRARQTGVWHRSVADGPVQGEQRHEFNLADIHIYYCLGFFQEELWERLFQEHGISPLPVVYEELVANYEGTMRCVMKFLDIGGEETPIPPIDSVQQADAVSKEWEERYRRMGAEAGIL